MDKIEKELKILNETKIVKDFNEVLEKINNEKKALSEKHAKKDKKGEIIKDENGNYEFESMSKLVKEVQALEELSEKDNQKTYDDYKEMLEQEANIQLHKVTLDNVPEDITPAQLKNILPIIDDAQNS